MYKTKMWFPALFIVQWPTGPVTCCEDHANKLIASARMLGSFVMVEKVTSKVECEGCVEENTPNEHN